MYMQSCTIMEILIPLIYNIPLIGSLSNSSYCRHSHTEVIIHLYLSAVHECVHNINYYYYTCRSDQQADEVSTASRKRKRCGKCTGCTYEDDCGECLFCKDKTKFGGEGKKKKCCVRKRCGFSLVICSLTILFNRCDSNQ